MGKPKPRNQKEGNRIDEKKDNRVRRKRHVVVIGATNRADSLMLLCDDQADLIVKFQARVPDEQARVKIFKVPFKKPSSKRRRR